MSRSEQSGLADAQWKLALVCGAGGFIGSHVVRKLLSRGWRVIALDDLSLCRSWDRLASIGSSLAFIDGDLLDKDLLRFVCEGVDTIVHCAGVEVAWPAAALQELVAVAVTGTLNLLECARSCGCRRLIRSGVALGADADDDSPVHAVHRLADHLLADGCRHTDLQAVVLRSGEVYGPGQQAVHPSLTPIASLLQDLRSGVTPLLCGQIDQPRDWLHVGDLVDAIDLTATTPLSEACITLDVASGDLYAIKSVPDHLRSLGVAGATRFRHSRHTPLFAASPDGIRARDRLNFTPRRTLLKSLEGAVPLLVLQD
jgi:nucleoside-diphosphate-sugar epimerase